MHQKYRESIVQKYTRKERMCDVSIGYIAESNDGSFTFVY